MSEKSIPTFLSVEKLSKNFGSFEAIQDISIEIEEGVPLTNSEKISTYEQVLETFLIHTDKTDDDLRIVAYLRKVFELSDSEHRAILRSLDRQLEEIVHRNVRQNIRYELKGTMDRLSEIYETLRVQK